MENEKILQLILDELKELKEGQKATNDRLNTLDAGQNELKEGLQATNDRLKVLEENQHAMHTELNNKIDKLSADVATTLSVITEAVDERFNKLKIVK